ncbi:MAG: hypothetical protein QY324_15665 [Anaerolineales bacterium]|nr:MAG: hypothetical protein QY324_15665 [Anaerolineales bacterium]HPP62485.1 hypothetical protein [Anaerolineales bacterium]
MSGMGVGSTGASVAGASVAGAWALGAWVAGEDGFGPQAARIMLASASIVSKTNSFLFTEFSSKRI